MLFAFIVAGEGLVGNEWMFRGIEPKVLAYGLVLLALTELLMERPGRCYAWLVPATYLHAFVGGFWAVIFTVALLARRETRVRAVLAGWGVSVVPRLLAQGLLDQGLLVNIAPAHTLLIQLYWHCWNLESEVLDALALALTRSAAEALVS